MCRFDFFFFFLGQLYRQDEVLEGENVEHRKLVSNVRDRSCEKITGMYWSNWRIYLKLCQALCNCRCNTKESSDIYRTHLQIVCMKTLEI